MTKKNKNKNKTKTGNTEFRRGPRKAKKKGQRKDQKKNEEKEEKKKKKRRKKKRGPSVARRGVSLSCRTPFDHAMGPKKKKIIKNKNKNKISTKCHQYPKPQNPSE